MNVLLLLVMILYIFALLGVTLFKEMPIDGGAVNDRANFSTLLMSALTLTRVLTGDGWSGIFAACLNFDENPQAVAIIYFGTFSTRWPHELVTAAARPALMRYESPGPQQFTVALNFFLVNLLCAVVLLQGIRSFYSAGMFMGIGRLLLLLEVKRRLMAPVLRMRDRRKIGGNIAGIFVTDKKMSHKPWVSKLLKVVPSRVQARRNGCDDSGGANGVITIAAVVRAVTAFTVVPTSSVTAFTVVPSLVQSTRSFSRGSSCGFVPPSLECGASSGGFAVPSLECFAPDDADETKSALRVNVEMALRREAAKRGIGYADQAELVEPLFLHAVWKAAQFAASGRNEPTEREIGDGTRTSNTGGESSRVMFLLAGLTLI